MHAHRWTWPLLALLVCSPVVARAADEADIILHNGRVVTVDAKFSIQAAVAIREGRVQIVGADADVLKLRGPKTEVVDLAGRMVLPGLIDSHVHPGSASMHEFDHPMPDMLTIADVLDYIRARAKVVPEGDWISIRQVFITRLKEQRWPTRQELDEAAPKHPVVFATGPDASVNSLALKLSGIDKDFHPTLTGGKIERDAEGNPTGILRSAGKYVKSKSGKSKSASQAERDDRMEALFRDYNANGLTGVLDRNSGNDNLAQYLRLHEAGRLTVRVRASLGVGNSGTWESLQKQIQKAAEHPARREDPWVRVIGIKTFLDGGMLTGSAYMREPWGISKIYSIDDPRYQGIRYIEPEMLVKMVRECASHGMQFTAHSVGDGAVHTLLDAYEAVNKEKPIRETRPCLTHSNFMSREAVEQAARLGVLMDIQPVWLYQDGHTLLAQFGYDRLRYFQPLKTIFEVNGVVGGGSDHMQKIGALRSVNLYHPFLGMQTAVTRLGASMDKPLHPEEALSREQMIRMYTINNAIHMWQEHETGSLEAGKWADLIVIDQDVLACPANKIRDTKVLRTFVAGKQVFTAK